MNEEQGPIKIPIKIDWELSDVFQVPIKVYGKRNQQNINPPFRHQRAKSKGATDLHAVNPQGTVGGFGKGN